ncbi:MAG: hypothetical protein ACLR6B_20820 [Blautia sp.]
MIRDELDDIERMRSRRRFTTICWSNFCVSYAFEPGSTFKPITVSVGH